MKEYDLLRKAEQGDVESQYVLGFRYRYGKDGSPKDTYPFTKSRYWLEMAAKNDHDESKRHFMAKAQMQLAFFYINAGEADLYTRDFAEGMAWLTRAADNGDRQAVKSIIGTHGHPDAEGLTGGDLYRHLRKYAYEPHKNPAAMAELGILYLSPKDSPYTKKYNELLSKSVYADTKASVKLLDESIAQEKMADEELLDFDIYGRIILAYEAPKSKARTSDANEYERILAQIVLCVDKGMADAQKNTFIPTQMRDYIMDELRKKHMSARNELALAKETGNIYNQLVSRKDSATTESEFEELSVEFRSLGYGDYANQARQCDNRCNELKYERLLSEKNSATTESDFEKLVAEFDSLGRLDARAQATECNTRVKDLKYERLVNKKNQATTIGEFKGLLEEFKNLYGHLDSQIMAAECADKLKELEYGRLLKRISAARAETEFAGLINELKGFAGYKDADSQVTLCVERHNELKYSRLLREKTVAISDTDLDKLAGEFTDFGYKDSGHLAAECKNQAESIRRKRRRAKAAEETVRKIVKHLPIPLELLALLLCIIAARSIIRAVGDGTIYVVVLIIAFVVHAVCAFLPIYITKPEERDKDYKYAMVVPILFFLATIVVAVQEYIPSSASFPLIASGIIGSIATILAHNRHKF